MSDSESPVEDTIENASTEESKPKRRRRRRRKPAGEAAETAPQEATEASEATADEVPDAGASEGAEGDRPPRRRRRRGGRGRRRAGSEPGSSDESRGENRDESGDGREPADRGGDQDTGRAPSRSSEPVSFDADAEYDPDIFADRTYDELPIRNSVLKGIHACGFNRPTHIQDQLIPIALDGGDVLGQAKTGTGKTAAFSIPALCSAERGVAFQTLILAPTRELAIQISAEIAALGAGTPITCAAIYGGQPIPIQKKKLEQNPEIIVATPGRLMDMYEHRNIHFRNVKQVILDEVDRMLDIGFRDDIRKILNNVKNDHQTIFVSATISDEIEKLANTFMHNPERLTLSSGALTVQLVDQYYVPCEPWYKRRLLLYLLRHEDPALTVIFCRTKATVDRCAKYLRDKGIDAQAIHGDLPQSKRNAVMRSLRSGELSVLVASDLAARGLDVDDITHVINYDLPDDPEVYVHRIGRTARAGKRGTAWSLVQTDQGDLLTEIEKLTNVETQRLEYPDFEIGDPPADIRKERDDKRARLEQSEAAPSRLADPDIPAAVDATRFPGGVVPTKLPPRLVRGRVNTTRGMKQMRDAASAKKPDTE